MRNERVGWRVVQASVPGARHARLERPGQDACRVALLAEGNLIAAVADGAGSAQFGEVGAARAAKVAVACIERAALPGDDTDAWERLLREALQEARQAVEAEAKRNEIPVREYATTLILMVAMPERVAVAQIGDGAAVVEREGIFETLIRPHSGEHANETTFLISPDALDTAETRLWTGAAHHLALFSDGLQRLALRLPDSDPHPPFFAPLFQFADAETDPSAAQEALDAFLRSPRLAARTDDDLTLILASRL